jgi:hypothetical protein
MMLIASQFIFSQTRKIVLIEEFTNANCNSCPQYDQNMTEFINNNWGNVISIQYHTWWPLADPMFAINEAENRNRIEYYDITTIQNYAVDGDIKGVAQNPYLLMTQTLDRFFLQSPVKIDLNATVANNNIDINIALTGLTNTIPQNLKLRVAILERKIVFDDVPGSNGVKEFNNLFRKMVPDINGTIIGDFSNGDIKTYSFTQSVNSAWAPANLAVVAWLQNDETKEIIQSNINKPTLTIQSNEVLADFLTTNQSIAKNYFIKNDNNTSVQLRLMIDTLSLDSGWTAQLNTPSGIVDSIDITLNSNETYNFSLNVLSDTNITYTSLLVKAVYLNDPLTPSVSIPYFGVVKNSDEILLVTDHKGTYDDVFLKTFDSIFVKVTHIKQNYLSLLFTYNRSNSFNSIFWINGWDFPTFINNDISFLKNFLSQGNKNLFIAGQDIGWDVNSSSGTSNFIEAKEFYSDILNAKFVVDNSGIDSIVGVSGTQFQADTAKLTNVNYFSPDAISSFDDDSTKLIFTYKNSSLGAGIFNTLNPENSKVIYLSFGLEQLDESSRNNIIRNSAILFNIPLSIYESNSLTMPSDFVLYQNYPNPFNPSTKIRFAIPSSISASLVSLKIYDVLGSEITTLINDFLTSGIHEVEFDGSKLPSGIYFYRLQSDGFSSVKKFVLLK